MMEVVVKSEEMRSRVSQKAGDFQPAVVTFIGGEMLYYVCTHLKSSMGDLFELQQNSGWMR